MEGETPDSHHKDQSGIVGLALKKLSSWYDLKNHILSLAAAGDLPCNDSLPLTFRTCPGLQTAKSGLNASWPQARFSLSAGCPSVLECSLQEIVFPDC
jgi:hypothetical protein